jgi:hypothetical protein
VKQPMAPCPGACGWAGPIQQHTLGTISGHSLNVGSCEQQLDPGHSPPVAVLLWQQQVAAGALQQLQPWYRGNHMAQGHLQWYVVSAAHSTQLCSSGSRDSSETQAKVLCSTSSSGGGSTSRVGPGSVGGSHPWAQVRQAPSTAAGPCCQLAEHATNSRTQVCWAAGCSAEHRWCCTHSDVDQPCAAQDPVDVGQRHADHGLSAWTALFAQACSACTGHVDACSCRPVAYPVAAPAWPAWMVLLRLLTVMCGIITAGASKHAVMIVGLACKYLFCYIWLVPSLSSLQSHWCSCSHCGLCGSNGSGP